MPVLVEWLDEAETISHWRFVGDWTWSEYFDQIAQAKARGERPQRVDVVFDFLASSPNAGRLPNLLSNFKSADRNRSENIGLVVLVGMSPFFRIMATTFLRMSSSKRNRIAADMETALRIIRDHRLAEQHSNP